MDFYKRIALVCQHIPEGTAATYGQIALLCGRPRNSRQVGYALRKGLAGEVPAHRIVNARGILSGAGAFECYDMQKRLLEEEGVEVSMTPDGWHVDLKRFGWSHELGDALWFRAEFEKHGI